MGRPDYIFGQFRETVRCRDAQHGDGVCCAFALQLVILYYIILYFYFYVVLHYIIRNSDRHNNMRTKYTKQIKYKRIKSYN